MEARSTISNYSSAESWFDKPHGIQGMKSNTALTTRKPQSPDDDDDDKKTGYGEVRRVHSKLFLKKNFCGSEYLWKHIWKSG